jgi:hypothetical protein
MSLRVLPVVAGTKAMLAVGDMAAVFVEAKVKHLIPKASVLSFPLLCTCRQPRRCRLQVEVA